MQLNIALGYRASPLTSTTGAAVTLSDTVIQPPFTELIASATGAIIIDDWSGNVNVSIPVVGGGRYAISAKRIKLATTAGPLVGIL